MGYPEGYPDRFKESIFAYHPDSGSSTGSVFSSNSPRDSAGELVFVFTRGGGKLNVYVFQYMGHIDGRDYETGGDVYDARDGTDTWVRLTDGTHTEERWLTITDVRELFAPAGWQAETKPTYTMTRAYGHKCYPKDVMNGQMYETETKPPDRV